MEKIAGITPGNLLMERLNEQGRAQEIISERSYRDRCKDAALGYIYSDLYGTGNSEVKEMKQGHTPTTMAGGKVEPKSRAVSVDKVSNIGAQIVRTQPPTKELHKGRGFEAPKPVACSVHKSGSQRKG